MSQKDVRPRGVNLPGIVKNRPENAKRAGSLAVHGLVPLLLLLWHGDPYHTK